jgi:hypothetical protein
MGPMGGIQTAAQWEAERERYLKAAQEAFPDWDFHPVFAGWEAVPKGTPVIRSMDLDGIIEKLRQREDR